MAGAAWSSLELADRVAILNAGRIEQVGAPDEVHDRPASPFVCGFVGEANRFEGRVEGGRFASGPVVLAAEGVRDGAATAFVRPHQLALAEPGRGFEVTVDRLTVQGPVGVVEGRTADGQRIEASFARRDLGGVEVRSTLRLAADHAHVFPDA